MQPTLSTYLVKPHLSNRPRHHLLAWRIRWHILTTSYPKLVPRTILILAGWLGAALSYQTLASPRVLPGQTAFTNQVTANQANAIVADNNLLKPAIAQAVPNLPGGPTGHLLPPGTLAPDQTYRNNYAYGQCTWYVAGRRPVPADWGHAARWYYHAIANGWSVGQIPAIGAIAWTARGAYGHVALVEQVSTNQASVYISEMNVRGVGVKSHRWVSASTFKYIY